MVDEQDMHRLAGAAALEHLTGPSRGTSTWLSGPALDISLEANHRLAVYEAQAARPRDNLIAHLQRIDGSYEISAAKDQPVWVNGASVTTRKLKHQDVIEFGETGPLSRFRLYSEDSRGGKLVSDILSDGLSYLRVSRRPLRSRLFWTLLGLFRRLTQETTVLFRVGVILAITTLAALTYQQNRLNTSLQQRIETGVNRLDRFAGALSQTRENALTSGDLKILRKELSHQLSSNTERLAVLEHRSDASARIITNSMPSVVFLQGGFGFRERAGHKMLRHVADENGKPLVSPMGQPLLVLGGDGPIAERQFTGTGFVVTENNIIITNRHVARPWESEENTKHLAAQGLDPVMIKYIAYVPGKDKAIPVKLVRVSESADLAALHPQDKTEKMPGLQLAGTPPGPGNEIIVMGYPTGLRALLAQSGSAFVEELQKTGDTGFWNVATHLAEHGYIAPLSSRGIISQTSSMTIIYDAETTHGGSGGPVLDVNGQIVAVNSAILPEYGGSNLGVPVAKLRAFLKEISTP